MENTLDSIMQQAKALQTNMEKARAEIATLKATGEAGAGLVKVTITGQHDVTDVSIDPSVLSDDKEMLEGLLAAAVNDANHRMEKLTRQKISEVAPTLPPGVKLPF